MNPQERQLVDELFEMGQSKESQHLLAIIGLRPDVSTAESLRRKSTSAGVWKRGGHRFLFYAYGSGALALPLCHPRLQSCYGVRGLAA